MIEVGMTTEGDWSISSDGSLKLVANEKLLLQQISLLLKTTPGDYATRPLFGFDMSEYLSLPNTAETAGKLEAALQESINALHAAATYDIAVDVTPIAKDQIMVQIEVTGDDNNVASLQQIMSFNAQGSNRFGYTISEHMPFDETSARAVVELIQVDVPSIEVELATIPMNPHIMFFQNDGSYSIVHDPISGDIIGNDTYIEVSGHIETPLGLLYDYSGIPYSGHLPATEFITEMDNSGEFVVSAFINGTYQKCEFTAATPHMSGYIFYQTPESAAIYVSGSLVEETPELTVNNGMIQTTNQVNVFDIRMRYTKAVMHAIGIRNEGVTLSNDSIAFMARSGYRWYARLPRTLQPGTYLAVYNTYGYR